MSGNSIINCLMAYLLSLTIMLLIYGIAVSPFMVTYGSLYTIVSFILWLIPITYTLYLVQQEDIYLHHR